MKNKKTNKPNLVTLSLEELKSISGGATSTSDEQWVKTSKAPEQDYKAPKSAEAQKKV